MASPMAPKPACCEYGPVWPKPETRIMISRGLMADSCSQPRPHFSRVPGRKFSSRKSDFATSCFRMSWPSACRRSSVMAFLLRATTGHQSDLPCGLLAAPVPHRVALARRLDLDHLGAEVAEQLAAERAREQRAEFDARAARRAGRP